MPRLPLLPLPTLALALLLSACGSDAPSEARPADAATAASAAPGRPAPGAAAGAAKPQRSTLHEQAAEQVEAARERRQARREWWADEALASELGLAAGQREAIAARVSSHRAAQQQSRDAVRQAQQDYRQALAAGELDRAREAARRHAALSAEDLLAQRMLVVDVLEALDPAQRTTLVADHPGLLTGLVSERPRRMREGRRSRDDGAARGE
jgi:hypothetical protein